MSFKDELEIALCVEGEAAMEEVLMTDRETSVEMPNERSRIYSVLQHLKQRSMVHVPKNVLYYKMLIPTI